MEPEVSTPLKKNAPLGTIPVLFTSHSQSTELRATLILSSYFFDLLGDPFRLGFHANILYVSLFSPFELHFQVMTALIIVKLGEVFKFPSCKWKLVCCRPISELSDLWRMGRMWPGSWFCLERKEANLVVRSVTKSAYQILRVICSWFHTTRKR
jgi:hypothetical protein